MANSDHITDLAKRLRPFLLAAIAASPGSSGQVWNYIILIHADGAGVDVYPHSAAGLTAALTAAASGDVIWVGPGTIAGTFSIPAGVALVGLGDNTVLSGTITLGDGAYLDKIAVDYAASSASALVGIVGPDSGQATIKNCRVSVTNSGAGDAYGAQANGGTLLALECSLTGTASGGGNGYGGYASDGTLRAIGGSSQGSSARFYGYISTVPSYTFTSDLEGWSLWLSNAAHYAGEWDSGAVHFWQTQSGGAIDNPGYCTVERVVDLPCNASFEVTARLKADGAVTGHIPHKYIYVRFDDDTTDYIVDTETAGYDWTDYTYNPPSGKYGLRVVRIRCGFYFGDTATWSGVTPRNGYIDTITVTSSDYEASNGVVEVYAVEGTPANNENALPGDRSAWDARDYQSLHTNDINDTTGIHHTLAELDSRYLGALVDHDHSGDAGDGGQFDAANLGSGTATDGHVLTADGAGNCAWEAPAGTITEILTTKDPMGAATYSVKAASLQAAAVGASATVNLLTLTGSGMVLGFWVALTGHSSIYKDGIIKVYVDGEASPSLSFDVGSLGLHWMTSGKVSTQHVSVEASSTQTSFVFKYKIPYGTAVQIDFVNPSTNTGTIWSNVYYTTDITDSRRLKSAGITFLNKATLAAGSTYDFLNLASGAGVLVWHSLNAVGASNSTFLESDVDIYVNGEATPSIPGTGTEDWFMDAFYFVAGQQQVPWAFCSYRASNTMVAGLDLLEFCGGMKFDDGIRVAWDLNDASIPVTTNVDISYLVLYYTGAGSTGGTIIDGTGSPDQIAVWDDADTLRGSTVTESQLRDAVKLQGRDLDSTAPTDGQALVWNDTASQWEPGDVSGTGGADADAIHDNVSGEINAVASKATPADNDLLLIEDSADSYSKKKITIASLPAGSGSGDSTHSDTYANRPAAASAGDLFFPSDGFVLERDTGAAWVPWGPLFPMTAPVLNNFAWINQGTGTASQAGGGIFLNAPAVSGDQWRILKMAAPATPYTVTAFVMPLLAKINYSACGLLWRQSSDGKLTGVFHNGFDGSMAAIKLDSPSSWNSNYSYFPLTFLGPFWLRIADNGTNRIYSFSRDGQNFLQLHSVGRTDFLTADEIGFACNSSNATWPAAMTLLSWKVS